MAAIFQCVFLLVFFLFAAHAVSNSDEIMVYQFPPDLLCDNFLTIQPTASSTLNSKSFSFCLRAMFWTWNSRVLVDIGNDTLFGLYHYNLNLGFFTHGQQNVDFPWENDNLSSSIWNTFCVSFNQTDLTLHIMVNGQLASTHHNTTIEYKADPITIAGQLIESRFYGQITDFNFWNKPLKLIEMKEFSSGCNTVSFLERLKPEVVLWSEVNITMMGNSTANYSMKREMLCSLTSTKSAPHSLLLFGNQVSYQESIATCEELQGNIALKEHIEVNFLKREERSLNELCSNKFWVFTNFSEANKYNHKQILEGFFTKNIEKCLYYDVSQSDQSHTNCKDPLCFVCQIPEDRLKVQVKSFRKLSLWDTEYFLINYNGSVSFVGLSSVNFLINSSDNSWSVLYYCNNCTQYQNVGYLQGKTRFPVGLQSLFNGQNGEKVEIKVTYVSFYS